MSKRKRTFGQKSKDQTRQVITPATPQEREAWYRTADPSAPLDPRQFAAGVIEHPQTALYQCWLSTNGQDVICVSAYHQKKKAEHDVEQLKSLITSGQLYDEAKTAALFEQLKQGSDEEPSPLPDDLVNAITRAIVRAVVHQDKK